MWSCRKGLKVAWQVFLLFLSRPSRLSEKMRFPDEIKRAGVLNEFASTQRKTFLWL